MSYSVAVEPQGTAATAHADRMAGVRLWLHAVAALVFVMVLVGGATRLTGSGLSITEWKPVTGALPPLTETAWLEEFAKYRTIPEYQLVNKGMSLDDFKFIYWWEWSHRFLGRLIGLAFVIPFLWFLWRGLIGRALAWRLGGILALGGLQGFMGWYMVKSGLVERTDVSQYRLALHLTLACAIFAALVWTARSLAPRDARAAAPSRLRIGALVLLGLVFLQIYLGALVAGLDAGLTYNTWPLMDGRLFPPASELFLLDPAWRNLFENVLTVQFEHRMAAYLVLLAAALHAVQCVRAPQAASFGSGALVLLGVALGQAVLGIATLLTLVPLPLALAHQAGAVVVLAAATVQAQRLSAARG